jgi:hypothetical protein
VLLMLQSNGLAKMTSQLAGQNHRPDLTERGFRSRFVPKADRRTGMTTRRAPGHLDRKIRDAPGQWSPSSRRGRFGEGACLSFGEEHASPRR